MNLDEFAILIPAHNEATNIDVIIENLHDAGFKNILVVNDGSSDATKEKAKKQGVTVISHIINLGYGGATRTGFQALLTKGHFSTAKYVVTMDADGQHLVEDVLKLAGKMTPDIDMLIGRRKRNLSNSPLTKTIFNKFADIFAFTLTGKYVSDTYSGLRCYKLEALRHLNLTLTSYAFCTELFVEAANKNWVITYEDVSTVYTSYSENRNRGIRVTESLKYVLDLLS